MWYVYTNQVKINRVTLWKRKGRGSAAPASEIACGRVQRRVLSCWSTLDPNSELPNLRFSVPQRSLERLSHKLMTLHCRVRLCTNFQLICPRPAEQNDTYRFVSGAFYLTAAIALIDVHLLFYIYFQSGRDKLPFCVKHD